MKKYKTPPESGLYLAYNTNDDWGLSEGYIIVDVTVDEDGDIFVYPFHKTCDVTRQADQFEKYIGPIEIPDPDDFE
jgi:hypothetical protein